MSWRAEFPQAELKTLDGNPMVYLDGGATTLKHISVIEEVKNYYSFESANVHRGAHFLANQGTSKYEASRETVAKFVNAKSANEIIFTRGTTESINLVAHSLAGLVLNCGDVILISEMEHHSNIVPWQLVAKKNDLVIKKIPMTQDGEIDLDAYKILLNDQVKLVCFNSVSNALGTVNPTEEICKLAKVNGSLVLVDGAQSVSAHKTDVQKWDCDFFVFSGHKLFGPTGIGVLFGKEDLLNQMPPYQGGGSMIDKVSFSGTTFLNAPQRFEAGTPHVAGALGLKKAIDFVNQAGLENICDHEQKLLEQMLNGLNSIDGLDIIGRPQKRAHVVSFLMEGGHPSDVGHLLDKQNIAVRTGHHCCQPLMERFGISGTVRASVSCYNNSRDIDLFLNAVKKTKEFF